mgnify:CR=1 FL=1|tara:strand:- start:1597 stop:1950 length:354 start_codon:yes stop_codon:yes gene_type:complete
MKKDIKKYFYFKFPDKSIFGFKILNCFHSSLSAYLIFISVLFVNPFFGCSFKQVLFGSFFNIVANLSFLILIINLLLKRKELNKKEFIFLNTPLFIFLPISILYVIGNIVNLISLIF